jgi:putative peptide zinc metalloprotease protein
MRFDGYYIMIDLIETPNLQQKSRILVQSKVTQWLFGKKNNTSDAMARMPMPKKRLWLFYTYAVLSWLYGYYVIYNLIVFMEPHLQPLGIEGLTTWFAALALTGWVVVPLWHFVKQLQLTREDLKPGGRWSRIAKVFGIPLLAFIGFCFVPIEKKIIRHSAVEVAEPEVVHPEIGGFIQEIFVKEGQQVTPGTLLAKLENRDLTERLAIAEQDVKRYELGITKALSTEKPEESRQLEALLQGAKAHLEKARQDVLQLELRAKTAGVVLTRDLEQKLGSFLRPPQDAFCEIAATNPMRIKIPLNEKQVRDVRDGNPVILIADADPNRKLTGHVTGEPLEMDTHNFPLAFSKERGGDVPTFHDPQTGREKLLEHTYAATVEVENPDGFLRYGMTMRAKIATGKKPYGKIVIQWITDSISLDYRF